MGLPSGCWFAFSQSVLIPKGVHKDCALASIFHLQYDAMHRRYAAILDLGVNHFVVDDGSSLILDRNDLAAGNDVSDEVRSVEFFSCHGILL